MTQLLTWSCCMLLQDTSTSVCILMPFEAALNVHLKGFPCVSECVWPWLLVSSNSLKQHPNSPCSRVSIHRLLSRCHATILVSVECVLRMRGVRPLPVNPPCCTCFEANVFDLRRVCFKNSRASKISPSCVSLSLDPDGGKISQTLAKDYKYVLTDLSEPSFVNLSLIR